jgi:AIR synthase-related protein
MSPAELAALAERLRHLDGLRSKRDIQSAAAAFPHQPFPGLGPAAALGDDAALLPAAAGRLLLASEGLHPALVRDDPWFAGWCGVLVNLSDIAAMGGRPLALVNSLWSGDPAHGERVLEGLRHAADRFGVPVVGGHTNLHSPYEALAVAVLGTVGDRVLSSRFAAPGDRCHLLIDTAGRFRDPHPFWDAATDGEGERLRRQLALMAELADDGLVHAAKDISMGGLVGTAVMFCESAGCGLRLDLEAITPPAGVELEAWLGCFPSYGFLLAAAPGQGAALRRRVSEAAPALRCQAVGTFLAEPCLRLCSGGAEVELWHGGREGALTGFQALW